MCIRDRPALFLALGLMLVTPGAFATPNLGDKIAEAVEAEDFEALRRVTALATRRGTPEEKLMAYTFSGEYWFGEGHAQNALEWYQKATDVQLPEDQLAFSRYKAAWCHYNLGDYSQSLEQMTQAVDSGVPQVHDEGLKDLVRFYVDAGLEDQGARAFEQRGQKALWEVATKGRATQAPPSDDP